MKIHPYNGMSIRVSSFLGAVALAALVGSLVPSLGEEVGKAIVEVMEDGLELKMGKVVVGTAKRGDRLTVVERRSGGWLGVKWATPSGEEKRAWVKETKVSPVGGTTGTTASSQKVSDAEMKSLMKTYVVGTKEKRREIYDRLDASQQLAEAMEILRGPAVATADEFFNALRNTGRERLLKEWFLDDAPYLEDGEQKAFDRQLEDEKYAADYKGVWPEHFWLLQDAAVVGLQPKNRNVVKMMEEAKADKYGMPSWVKTGPILVLKPAGGKWKISATARMIYAYEMTKMLRRQDEEAQSPKEPKDTKTEKKSSP